MNFVELVLLLCLCVGSGNQTSMGSGCPVEKPCQSRKDVFSKSLGSEVSLQPRALRKLLGEGWGGVCMVAPAAQVALAQGCCLQRDSGTPSSFFQTHQSPACLEGHSGWVAVVAAWSPPILK